MDNRKRVTFAVVVTGCCALAGFLFFSRPGLGLIRAAHALIENPSQWKEIVSNLNFLGILFTSLSAIPVLRFLFTIYNGGSIITGSSLLEKAWDESDTVNGENAEDSTNIRLFATSNAILLLFGISVLFFIIWTAIVFHQGPSGNFEMDTVVVLSFLVVSAVPWLASACLATYLGIRQRRLKQAIVSIILQKGFVDIELIVNTTKKAEKLVKEAIAELQSGGIIPACIPVIVAKNPQMSNKPSTGEP